MTAEAARVVCVRYTNAQGELRLLFTPSGKVEYGDDGELILVNPDQYWDMPFANILDADVEPRERAVT